MKVVLNEIYFDSFFVIEKYDYFTFPEASFCLDEQKNPKDL